MIDTQTTSAEWKALWSGGSARVETVAVIDGREYREITAPVITRAAMWDGLSVGNVVSASCRFTLRTEDAIPRAAEVRIRMRLTDGETASEWLPAGTFYISRRSRDAVSGLLDLECCDALLKANALMSDLVPWTTETGEVMTTQTGEWIRFSASYPRRMEELAADLALILGLELDPRTELRTGEAYVVNAPDAGATVRDILGKIGAANGGNWIVTPAGRLRLTPVADASEAESAGEAVEVAGVTGRIHAGGGMTVTGVRFADGDAEPALIGTDAGIVMEVSMPEALAEALAERMIGLSYVPFSLTGAVYDPAAEIGDCLRAGAGDEIRSVLYGETVTLGPAVRGDLSAPEPAELADEYPYIGASARTLSLAKDYAGTMADAAEANAIAAANALNDALTQEEIFNRLTDNGEVQGLLMRDGRIYLNASYINTGTLVADFIRGGTLTLGGGNDVSGVLQVLDAAGNVIGTWNRDGISIAKGSITGGTINGASLTLGGANDRDGVMEVLNASGATAARLSNGGLTMNAGNINLPNNSMIRISFSKDATRYAEFSSGGMRLYLENGSVVRTYRNGFINVPTMPSVVLGALEFAYSDGSDTWRTRIFPGWLDSLYSQGDSAVRSFAFRQNQLQLKDTDNGSEFNVSTALNSMSFTGNGFFSGSLTVSGTKSRKVDAGEYGERLLYCYETPSPLFGDVGEGMIGEDGRCYVWLDAVLARTVSSEGYQVFLQRYGPGDCWVAERRSDCFVVEGAPGLRFGWELKAKQRDYDQRRLDSAEAPFAVPEQSYGASAAQYIKTLNDGRISA